MNRGFSRWLLTLILLASPAGSTMAWGQETSSPVKPQAVPKAIPQPVPKAVATKAKPAGTMKEAEKLFLTGSISARELQRRIAALHLPPPRISPKVEVMDPEQALKVLRDSKADPARNPAPGPAIQSDQLRSLNPDPAVVGPSGNKDFTEIEDKMDELLRRKKAREQEMSKRISAAKKARTQTMTHRQQLDALLRLYIEGEISEEDYKRQRAEIIASKPTE